MKQLNIADFLHELSWSDNVSRSGRRHPSKGKHMSDIWKRRNQIDKERREKTQELMGEYDRTVFYPARKQLVEDCEKEGHTQGKFHDNGWGWTWWWCGKCGTLFDKQGPDT